MADSYSSDRSEDYGVHRHGGGGSCVYRTLMEEARKALLRKRRLRLIYKWRHGLACSHQPANRDRGKLSILEGIRWHG